MPVFNEKEAKQKIAESLNLLGFTDSQQNKIISGLLDNISARINIAIYDKLTEEDRQKLQKISRAKEKDAILNYIKSKIRNLRLLVYEITRETIEEFEDLRKGQRP